MFLPYINNEIGSSNSSSFKDALTKLEKLVLVGGPDDGVITPWQSRYDFWFSFFHFSLHTTSYSHFGYFNESLEVVPVMNRDIYLEDKIGLKELNEKKRLIRITRKGITHLMWHIIPSVIREVILPYLD